ncbi:PREDICTED: CST complex subunit CTC1 isoform X2 [Lupinus angustifolius]|uniref:CST complex subunit CTC1 isoform X2 n=1 Tax=Lupinus angustifolius TaxID=3871 RepID=UPI00092F1F81|nr:PREDICTED: CST complex subunit CTC1 isoform X2 [Lupinus angustifolius]
MEDSPNIARLGDLLRSPRPLTATASPHFPSTASPPPPPPPPTLRATDHHRIITSLNRATIIVGTLNLAASSSPPPPCSCFRFSDSSATVCCDVLRFQPSCIGKEIRVTAWNFIPFKHHRRGGSGGFLEIIQWSFSDSSEGLKGLHHVDSLPLVPNHRNDDSSKAQYHVFGVVESVGPVSVVPCSMAVSISALNSSSKVNLPGFLVQLMCCECRLCCSKECNTDFISGTLAENQNGNGHSFTKMQIVYFCGNAYTWHATMTKLICTQIMVSSLKKKLIYITKDESRVMYVTADMSVFHVCRFSEKWMPCLKSDNIMGKGECGAYTGVIKDVYMQGMALELDHDISVRNVHFMDPKFSWTKIIILGACIKTSIIVESFSPLETGCNVVLQPRSMLGKFIQSLPFSARLWVLLLVSSLRKKFAGFLSDKEILGTQHKEGIVQMYASSLLPPSMIQTEHGAFMGFCRHDLNGCGREMHCDFLKLIIPMSIFIYHCIDTLQRKRKLENHCKVLPVGNLSRFSSHEAGYDGISVRRIISSEDTGIVLIGYLKINPSTKRLQLVDATGGIDVLIPDLPFTWNPNKIYEVKHYDIVVDGIGELVNHSKLLESWSLSCRKIFNCTQATRKSSTSIFAYFLWKNANCRKFSLYPYCNRTNETGILESGSYHLLRVSHKFPVQEKSSSNMRSNKSSIFVEAILLPYTLLLAGKSEVSHSCNAPGEKTKELSEYCISDHNKEQVSNKRQKLAEESISSSIDDFHTSIYKLNPCSNSFMKSKEIKKCLELNSSHDISCLVTFRSLQNEKVVCPAILQSTSPLKDRGFKPKPSARKILLEFSFERFLKYQLLQIGGYYIIEHNKKDCFCTTKDAGFGSCSKFLVDSGKNIWSLSFISDEVLLNYESIYKSAEDSLYHPSIDGVLPKDKIEQLLLKSNIVDYSGAYSDVFLYLPVKLTGLLEDNIMESKDSQSQQDAVSEESANIPLSNGTVVAMPTLCSGYQSSNCLFPEGNLVSFEGNVVEIQDMGSSFSNLCLSGSLDALRLKGLVGTKSSFCIHVLVHHHIVRIFGSISKHDFPTGFGPGVTATFHRILDARAQNKFMLLPVSFIVIKSIEVYDKQCSARSSRLRPTKEPCNASPDSFTCLISQLHWCPSHKQIMLRCRVVAVVVLILERKSTSLNAETKMNARETNLDIPLACFLVDDGSSSCCCWANSESAATLLRLCEGFPASYNLGNVLKKYKRIIAKNHGSFIDSPYQDVVVSDASDNALCSSDENLLKFVIFNACIGRVWNVVASVMDVEEVKQLKKEYPKEMVNMQTTQNIWAEEVSCPHTVAEARNMIQKLTNS